LTAGPCLAQKTDVSLFLKSDGVQVAELASKSGDLYKTAGHHGPAVEKKQKVDIRNLGQFVTFLEKAAIPERDP
jgi:hypothetical protein